MPPFTSLPILVPFAQKPCHLSKPLLHPMGSFLRTPLPAVGSLGTGSKARALGQMGEQRADL